MRNIDPAETARTEPATSLILKRRFRASPEALFAAWTEAGRICAWMGPEEVISCEAPEFDVREGGRFRLVMTTRSSGRPTAFGEWLAIDRPAYLKFTWAWEDEPENESLITLDFKPAANGTDMTLTHVRFSDTAARDRHNIGWSGSFDKLDALLAAGSVQPVQT